MKKQLKQSTLAKIEEKKEEISQQKKRDNTLFIVLEKLFTARTTNWINFVNLSKINNIIILDWIGRSSKGRQAACYLDKYAYILSTKHFLLLAYKVLPKFSNPPFIQYLKPKEDVDLYQEIWKKIQKRYELSDRDLEYIKPVLYDIIEKDKINWFQKFGVDAKTRKQHGMTIDDMKEGGIRKGKGGLELFGV